jgi:hypothetical protein
MALPQGKRAAAAASNAASDDHRSSCALEKSFGPPNRALQTEVAA